MPFDLPVRYSSGAAILSAPGSITINSGCDVRSAVASFGLGELVAAYTAAVRRGGALKLLHVGDRVAKLLTVARLDQLLESHSDKRTAIASFRTTPNAKARAALDGFLDR
jgi:hypothetical protein